MACCDGPSAGELNKSVTFQRRTRTPDGAGGFSTAWGTLKATYAKIETLSGSERYASDRVEATSRFRLTVRHFADLTEDDVVVFKSRQHNICSIRNVDLADRWLIIEVDGGVAV